jgi:hypothetical protein
MKRPVRDALCAVCFLGFVGMASLVRSQTPSEPPSRPAEQPSQQDAPPGQPQPDGSIPPPAGAASDKVVELTRGPINQGFAETTNMTPQPSPPVTQQPPQPIDEMPPDAKPDNPNATWVPGYWSWDQESNNHIWVSGSWRVPPPGHRWIPGYWNQGSGNYQWVSGFWSPEDAQDVTYLPAPPSYRDEGVDTSEPPDAEHFWVPGFWGYRTRAYEWQPGYWSRIVSGWMWVPAHYAWTPYGYVFTAGHWDYPLEQRGLLFTPVRFTAPIYTSPAFVYTPQYLVAVDNLVDNLFVNPGFQCYYFGDYYGPQYARFGILPWFNVGTGPYLYDPIFAYRTTSLWRTNPHWRDDFRRRYDRLVRDPALRPPRTWRDYQRLVRDGKPLGRDRMVALPLRDALKQERFSQHITRLSETDRHALRQQNDFRRNLVNERSRLEHGAIDRPGERVPDRERPGMRPGERPTGRPVERPNERPITRPNERPGERPTGRPVERPNERPVTRPGERPTERPAERPTGRPVERPNERPVERPAVRPGERPTEMLKPQVRPEPATGAPRTWHLPARGPEPGRGTPQAELRGATPQQRTPTARPQAAPRVNLPRPPQPDRAVRAPARPAPRPEREKK